MGLLTEPNHLLLGATQPLYQIDRSLRFNDDDSAMLSRTFGTATGRKIWTWSGWLKRGNLGTFQHIFGVVNTGSEDRIQFTTNNNIKFYLSGTNSGDITTVAVYRDSSAWYHIVIVCDTDNATAVDRAIIYVNGVRQNVTGTNFSLGATPDYNGAVAHYIGRDGFAAGQYFDGYMAEVHFVDGQALDPTSFGEFDTNGVWRPIKVSGLTYGTNGFYLSFADNTSTTTLGYDDAGSNDWTLNNFSVTAGAGNDSLEDTPTNNWCVLSSLQQNAASAGASGSSISNGGLDATFTITGTERQQRSIVATPSSGKWYGEVTVASGASALTSACDVGVVSAAAAPGDRIGGTINGVGYRWNGQKEVSAVASAYGSTYTVGDVIGIAIDLDAGTPTVTFYKNNVSQGAINLPAGAVPHYFGVTGRVTAGSIVYNLNFGQRPFAYTPPTGFSALNTANLPTPDIADPSAYMNAVTYTGAGSSLGVTGVGFQPDLVWIKGRSGATDHALYDSIRGVERQLESNTTTDETIESTGLTAFGSNGFTIGSLAQVNTSAATYVAWNWKKGVTPGFDIVSYTGTGSATTIQHSLGAAPKLIIVKARSTASTDQGWPVYHASNTTAPETDYLLLNSTAATADLDTVWNDTAPTASVFSVGTNALVNALNDTYVAYLFAEVEGFSKFGSYTGNGSADGPFVWCGFRPRWLMVRRTDTTASWWQVDAARSPLNAVALGLYPNLANAEDASPVFDLLSNGFKPRLTDVQVNASGGTYVFAAFAEMPFSAPSNAR